MSASVPVSFIEQYQAEVKQVYQQTGSLLRNTVRTVTQVNAERIYFPKLGKGHATQKARHADVVPMNLEHSRAYADMADFYAPEYIDDLDQAKLNWSLASQYAIASGNALGRTTDEILIGAVDATPNELKVSTLDPDAAGAITLQVISGASAAMAANDVPLDRMRYAVISPEGLAQLQAIPGVTSSDFVREQILVSGDKPAFWMGFNWVVSNMLPEGVLGYFYHRQAVGHGIARDIRTSVDWVPEKVAWLVNSWMSMGATIIDPDGVFKLVEGD